MFANLAKGAVIGGLFQRPGLGPELRGQCSGPIESTVVDSHPAAAVAQAGDNRPAGAAGT